FVSSESHRSARPLDLDSIGAYVEYGMVSGMQQYAHTKLALCTFASELARRLRDERGIDVAVHALCPGPVDSHLAPAGPLWVKPILKPPMRLFFNSPEVAARPVTYLACARALENQTGCYLHMMHDKEPAPAARDARLGRRLWEVSEALLRRAERGVA